jgi:hypothetical protein
MMAERKALATRWSSIINLKTTSYMGFAICMTVVFLVFSLSLAKIRHIYRKLHKIPDKLPKRGYCEGIISAILRIADAYLDD